MVTDIEKERDAINSKLLATAKKLKVRGMPDQEIKELTGLKLAEIRKL
jgi:hypothetical protein